MRGRFTSACSVLGQPDNPSCLKAEAIAGLQQLHMFAANAVDLTNFVPVLCQNLQRKKILDSQKPLLRSFKPDLLPPGSPARKRIRSSRSSSKTLSFICLDTDDHSDDEIADPLVLQGIILLHKHYI